MGLFDLIHFPQLITCVACQAEIASTQTKAFDPAQNDFYVGDCVGHAEDMHILFDALLPTKLHVLSDTKLCFKNRTPIKFPTPHEFSILIQQK